MDDQISRGATGSDGVFVRRPVVGGEDANLRCSSSSCSEAGRCLFATREALHG